MRSPSFRRILLASGFALLLGGSALGLALAQETPTPAPPTQAQPAHPGYQAFLDALARRLGITSERLQQAITETHTELGLPERGMMFGRGKHFHGFGRGGMELLAAAQAIGIPVEQLRQELPGQSLAQVAQAHGKDPADVAKALKDAANQKIDQAVTAGRLTAEQATQLKEKIAQGIDQHMAKVWPAIGKQFHGRQRGTPAAPTPAS